MAAGELRQMAKESICTILGAPPKMVPATDDSPFAVTTVTLRRLAYGSDLGVFDSLTFDAALLGDHPGIDEVHLLGLVLQEPLQNGDGDGSVESFPTSPE